ncbi:MAG: vWA domain-containing protein [Solirubrobacterales bacterium]
MKSHDNGTFDVSNVIGNYLNVYFGQEQGVRLGESVVVSLKAIKVNPDKFAHVKILSNRDAGQKYLDYIDPGQVVHLAFFHKTGVVHPKTVAREIFTALEQFVVEENPRLSFMEDEKFDYVVEYALKIMVVTRLGKGVVYDLVQGAMDPPDEGEESLNHVRILMKLTPDKYGVVLPVAEAVEEAIYADGLQPAKVKRISHTREKEQPESYARGFFMIPWKKRMKGNNFRLMRESQNQLIMKLAEKFGTVEEVEEFLSSQTANIFKRTSQEQQKRKWADLDHHVEQLEELGLLKDTLIGPILTKEGKELTEYIIKHRGELEAEMRRVMRRAPKKAGRFRRIGIQTQKPSTVSFTNRNKVKPLKDNTWFGDLAVPETIIAAKKGSLIRRDTRFTIRKEDLQVYTKRSYVPMDICLLIDASASMSGEKRQAACYLAEHLLLTGRERVSVVTFQEMKARVVVPFTRNQKILSHGLSSIKPGGLTPLADGIVLSTELIKSNKLSNPVLVLITDGMPNFPLWTFDAKQDALEASQRVKDSKVRFICIGVEANKEFMAELAEVGKGTLYVVDDLNRNNLIEIVKYERKIASIPV